MTLNTFRSFRRSSVSWLLVAALAMVPFAFTTPGSVAVSAQGAAITQTTLSVAANATQNTLTLASVSGLSVGYYIYVDRELFKATAINSMTVTVSRSQGGTPQTAHVSGAVAWIGPYSAFTQSDAFAAGQPCTTAGQPYLPKINFLTGSRFMCDPTSLVWYREVLSGFPSYSSSVLAGNGASTMTYTASGAITIRPGTQFINGTTLAMTLANPTTAQNGMIMTLISTNASAHTITYTAGFGGGTTARDVATYGGAVNDNMVIQAVNGVWWVLSTRNVTLG